MGTSPLPRATFRPPERSGESRASRPPLWPASLRAFWPDESGREACAAAGVIDPKVAGTIGVAVGVLSSWRLSGLAIKSAPVGIGAMGLMDRASTGGPYYVTAGFHVLITDGWLAAIRPQVLTANCRCFQRGSVSLRDLAAVPVHSIGRIPPEDDGESLRGTGSCPPSRSFPRRAQDGGRSKAPVL